MLVLNYFINLYLDNFTLYRTCSLNFKFIYYIAAGIQGIKQKITAEEKKKKKENQHSFKLDLLTNKSYKKSLLIPRVL